MYDTFSSRQCSIARLFSGLVSVCAFFVRSIFGGYEIVCVYARRCISVYENDRMRLHFMAFGCIINILVNSTSTNTRYRSAYDYFINEIHTHTTHIAMYVCISDESSSSTKARLRYIYI